MKIKKIAALGLAASMMMTLLAGCGINKEAIVATMDDGTEVSLGLVNFMCRFEQAKVDDAYRGYFGDDVWDTDLYSSGSTMEDDTKDSVLENVHEMYTLKNHMDDYGVTIDADTQASITEAATSFMEGNSQDALDEMGATQEIVEEYLTLATIKQEMYDAIIADADTEVSDEDANMRGYTVVQNSLTSYYDSTTYSSVDYTEDEIATIESAFALIDSEAKEDPSALEDIATNYGYEASYETYAADDESLEEDVKTALDSMEVGDVSDVITTDSYIYVLRMDTETDEDATESNRESIIEDRQDTLYNDTLSGWQENDGWTVNEKLMAKISFKNILTQTTESTEETESTEVLEPTEAETETDTEAITEETTESLGEEATESVMDVEGTETLVESTEE